MRRLLIVAVVVSAVLSTQGFIGIQKTDAHKGPAVVSSTAGQGLNLRSGPGAQFRVLLTMHPGDALTMRGHRGNWLYATHLASGLTGWAWLAFTVPVSGTSRSGGGSSAGGLQLCWDTLFNWTACAPEWIAQAISDASRYYGVPYWAMMGIASCESAYRPNIVNQYSGVIGLYQFEPSTFYWQSPGANIWNVYDQAYTAAKMLARGLSYMFDCAWRVGY